MTSKGILNVEKNGSSDFIMPAASSTNSTTQLSKENSHITGRSKRKAFTKGVHTFSTPKKSRKYLDPVSKLLRAEEDVQ